MDGSTDLSRDGKVWGGQEGVNFGNSLVHFFLGRETHRFFRSHKNLTYLKDHAKSCPLHSIGFQGTPRGIMISKTD